MGLTKRFLKVSENTFCEEIESKKALWGETTASVNESTPVEIQETTGVILKQFHHLLWFAHMSLLLRNIKEAKR